MNKMKKFLIFCVLAVMVLAIPLDLVSSAQQRGGKPRLKIVHLGDSYSSGNGARSATDRRNYHGVEGCYRSPTNWGGQFAQSLSDRFAVTYINRACSGGVVENIHNARKISWHLKNLDGSCPTPDYPNEEFLEDIGWGRCGRFVKPQIEAVDESVDLVLMTMGGNDLGFNSIVSSCYTYFAGPKSCRENVEDAIDGMPGLQQDLIDTFAALRARMRPDARILYVSYPHITLDVGFTLILSVWPFYYDEYEVTSNVRALAIAGEAAQRAAVEAANAAAGEDFIHYYDGTKDHFNGNEPHPSQLARNPDRWINEFEGLKIAEWYHFNPLGHENLPLRLPDVEDILAPEPSATNIHLDIAFVIEASGDMDDFYWEAKQELLGVTYSLPMITDSYRVSIVSYRDFPENTDRPDDYPSRVDLEFTDDLYLIQAALDSLETKGAEKRESTVFSGIQTALELPWRDCVSRVIVVLGSSPAYSPEPISNLTVSDIITNNIALGRIPVYGVDVDTYGLSFNGPIGEIADSTGGFIMGINTFNSTMFETIIPQPFACFDNPYSGMIGEPVIFDVSGSFDPSGSEITSYAWDFNGDGEIDLVTGEPFAEHVYGEPYDGYVTVCVTNAWGDTTCTSVRVDVNEHGYASQGDEEPCELDEDGYSIILDDEGLFIRCTPTHLPQDYPEGVIAISEDEEEISSFPIYLPLILQNK